MAQEKLKTQPYQLINAIDLTGENISGQIVIAVIDDGFLLDHNELKECWWRNESEIPNNGIDDDENGFVDDVVGWDIVDADNDVVPNGQNKKEYYHGTSTVSIILQMIEKAYGKTTANRVKIMPIKALSDYATRLTMENGYQGLKYALANNPDIICMAWSGGTIDAESSSLIQQALQKDILLLASAGNASTNKLQPPASLAGVYSVAAIDENYKKLPRSNYGIDVDFVAFGDGVRSAHSDAPNAFFNATATSAAVALACGASAILKIHSPKSSWREIMSALKNTAVPVDMLNPRYLAQLGSGLPNVKDAIDYLDHPEARGSYYDPNRSKASVFEDGEGIKFKARQGIKAIEIMPKFTRMPREKCRAIISLNGQVHHEVDLRSWSSAFSIPGNEISIELSGCKKNSDVEFDYQYIPIDSTTLYCKELVEISDTIGFIADGSGNSNYANNVSCKWLLTTPNGSRLKISFQEMNIHPSDQILFFYGNTTLQENLVAKFSGDQIPPTIISASNQLTVWFITDNTNTARGWQLKYETTLEEPGLGAD